MIAKKQAKKDFKEGSPTPATTTTLENNAIQATDGPKKKKA